jgi:hypothetical protein
MNKYKYFAYQLLSNMSSSFIFYNSLTLGMLENIAYFGIGFVVSFLALEAAWHFTACKIRDKSIKPCMYKQVKLALVRA